MIIGVIAIGRNEGDRLRACLVSAKRDCANVAYVDSGSTDGSVALAKSLGVAVVELDLAVPFTAARARNEGFAALKKIEPNLQAAMFVDGDCEIVDGWMAKAAAALAANPKAAAICGRRRERFPSASIYNRLCDLEWNTPIGTAKSCGGDALIRATAFDEVDGYNPAVIAGEEPEMCVRLRAKAWTIHRIDAEMTLHDAAMTKFSQWWKRNLRAGHAYGQGFAMHGEPPERFREREVRSIEKWTNWLWIALIVTAAGISFFGWHHVWLWIALFFPYPLLAVKVAVTRRRRGATPIESFLYGVSVVIGKLPQRHGLYQFRRAHRRGDRIEIIEYKVVNARIGVPDGVGKG